ncbi:MAG: DinB family protein [Reichenbachiella sp.]|uniref:DinB family protein n=1 Tax=Reichenbachiella sp. TaxID=2184521 RepID=UPI003298DC8E
MTFDLNKSLEILKKTPSTLQTMIGGLSEDWTSTNEGEDTWSVYDVLGHLIHGEKTDWIPRLEIILSTSGDRRFKVFDRFAQFGDSKGKSLDDLLKEFGELRDNNLEILKSKQLNEEQLDRKGIHPEFGEVTARQLLSTWVVHDLNHFSQISRVMAYQYKTEVGPWVKYLGILNQN